MPAASIRLIGTLAAFALLQSALSVTVVQRSIPSTTGNQDFFSLSQSLLSNGNRKISSCGPELPEVERCIRVCNSPGLAERGGCCCIAVPGSFFVGVRGGCRYTQRIQNFTASLIYKSSPVFTDAKFFGPNSCARSAESGSGGPCSCSIQWEATPVELDAAVPLPSPSTSASPVLTATPSPVPVVPTPIFTPEPSIPIETIEPPVDSTTTPTPDILLPAPPLGPIVTPDATKPTEDPTATEGPTATEAPGGAFSTSSEEPAPTEEPVPSGLFDDSETQAEEDDGSVCVDERYLTDRGFSGDSLVHKYGLMANVLCPHDRTLPCGTADHKVRFAGQDMSYEYMCSHAGVQCRADRMRVNSVYSHMWSDVAHEDVLLTMFDIRYGETAQKTLHTVMRAWRAAKKNVFA